MKKTILLLAIVSASSLALADNSKDAGKCVALGSAAQNEPFIEKAFRLADNRKATMDVAKKELDKLKKEGKSDVPVETARDWKKSCEALGLDMGAKK